jgi:NADH-quinone oxidoreductase subunit N
MFEYVLLLLLSIVGMLTIISSYDLVTMYLAIELQSLCFYVVTNLKFYSNFSIEAGLKYFILGALSSGILLFGSSLLYGFTGLTNFLDLTVLFYYYNLEGYNLYYYECALIGLIFIYCGILFKIGIVPFHMWVSDIYEGSPTNITFFFAVVPQISIISLLLRLNIIFIYAYLKYLYIFFMCLSILSIIVGTLGAIYQTKLKRIIAYSSISNMGYILSVLLTVNVEGLYGVIFYIIVYNIVSIGIWVLLLSFRNQSNGIKLKEIGDLVVLFKSNKYLSIIFFIFLFSAMGIPPMLGFFPKLFILLNIIELKMYFFALFIIIMNSIGVIYYLRLIKIMYSSNIDKSIFLVDIGEIKALFLVFLAYLNIFFFCYPNHLLLLIHNIILFLSFK